jgi:hypothetical protein
LLNLGSIRDTGGEFSVRWTGENVKLTLIVEVHPKKLSDCLSVELWFSEFYDCIFLPQKRIFVSLKIYRFNFSSLVKKFDLLEVEVFEKLNDDLLGKHSYL